MRGKAIKRLDKQPIAKPSKDLHWVPQLMPCPKFDAASAPRAARLRADPDAPPCELVAVWPGPPWDRSDRSGQKCWWCQGALEWEADQIEYEELLEAEARYYGGAV